MTTTSPTAQDTTKLYREWELAFTWNRMALGVGVAAVGNLSFSGLDWLIHRDQFFELLPIRALEEQGVLACAAFHWTAAGRRWPMLTGLFTSLTLCFGISQATVPLGGFGSSYANGLSITMLGLCLIMPVNWRLHAGSQLLTLLYYGACGALLGPPVRWEVTLENFFMVGWTALLSSLGVWIYERLQRSNFDNRAELVHANASLRQLDRAKTEFFANVNHELRTPLTLIVGCFRSLGRSGLPAQTQPLVDAGLRNASRLLVLINELLDLSRLEFRHDAVRKRVVDLGQLVRQVAANFQTPDDGALQLRGAEAPVLAELDGSLIKKVVYNLLSNAFKFTAPSTRRVVLSLEASEDRVLIQVADNGIGIAQSDTQRIFQRFTQLEGASTRRFEGTGIGLSLVKQVAEQHGGAVTVTSEVGRGSLFTVSLPRGHPAGPPADVADDEMVDLLRRSIRERPANHAPLPQANVGAPTLLVAEDNPDLRDYLHRVLSPRFRVFVAAEGAEALEKAKELQPELILTDLMMPRVDGRELLRSVRADPRLRDTPVVFLTARDAVEARVEALEAGADDYLPKPFSEEELLARVENLLQARRQTREVRQLNVRLEARIEEQMAELVRTGELARFLPRPVADALQNGDAGAERLDKRDVTVLFVDLVGFTPLTDRLPPDTLVPLLNDFLREMTAAAVEHEGTVDKFVGDAVMVIFGAPTTMSLQAQALSALRCAGRMLERMIDLNVRWRRRGIAEELHIRIGINTGPGTVGVFGSDHLKSYTAVGSVVNVAARLQAEAPPGGALFALATQQNTDDRVKASPKGALKLKGVAEPVSAFLLEDVGG